MDNEMKEMFGVIIERFDKIETRFDNLETRFDNLETKVDNLEIRFDKLETKVDSLENQLNAFKAETMNQFVRVTDVLGRENEKIKEQQESILKISSKNCFDIEMLKAKIN